MNDNTTTAAQPLDLDKLSGDIMNLPSNYRGDRNFEIAYKTGHRDARHAAAELVNEQAALIAQARAAQPAGAADTTASASDDEIKEIAINYAHFVAADIYDVTKYDCAEDFFNCVRACIEAYAGRASLAPVSAQPSLDAILNCYSPDDTVSDYQDKIRALYAAPVSAQQGAAAPVYAVGASASIEGIADELEAEALNYEGDFADTVKGCVEALREIAAAKAPAAQAVDAVQVKKATDILRIMQREIPRTLGDINIELILEDIGAAEKALSTAIRSASPASTPEAAPEQQQAVDERRIREIGAGVYGFPIKSDDLQFVQEVLRAVHAQQPAAPSDDELHALIVKVLSGHRMVRMFEVEDGGAFGNSYPLIDRLSLDDGQDVASGKEEIDTIAWAIVDAMPLAAPTAGAATTEADEWRVGEFWSSARPDKKVLVLSDGAREIESHGKHKDFIRWVGSSGAATTSEDVRDAAIFRWLIEDHDNADVRNIARALAMRLGTSSYFAITRDIEHAMRATQQEGGK
jgi:hypothetical protein